MEYNSLIYSILILALAGFLYNKLKLNIEESEKIDELNIIKKYLLKETEFTIDKLSAIKKPIIWIHLDYVCNSRNWESFLNRNTNELNQDYLYLTIRSIINKCSDDFHIILIDDKSFSKILENWTVDLSKISCGHKENIRLLALMKTLHTYGGVLIEPSFILFKSIKYIYYDVLTSGKMFVGEFANKGLDSHIMHLTPSTNLIGCIKNCPIMYEFMKHIELLVNIDYTNETQLLNLTNKWLLSKIQNKEINYIDGIYLGIKNKNNDIITLEDLMSSTYIGIHENAYGLYIPHKDLLKRNLYNWFVYLNTEKVLESNTNIGKYLLISNQ